MARQFVPYAGICIKDPDGDFSMTADTVIEPETVSRFSGLYDANGVKLFVREVKEPLGFLLVKS